MKETHKKSIIGLGSGQGSTLEFFCEQVQKNKTFVVDALVTDNSQSRLIQVANKFKIPCHQIAYDKKNPSVWDEKLCQVLKSYEPSLIILAGFLKKIGPQVLRQFPHKIINSHPSLLPDFGGAGFYGLKVHQAVLSAGKKETGISIHLVNQDYDRGRILDQLIIPIKKNETAKELEIRIKQQEKLLRIESKNQ